MSDELYAEITKSLATNTAATLSIDERKVYLIENIDSLNIAERVKIGKILKSNNKKENLEASAIGTVINLDLLGDNLINKMYDTMIYIISSRD